jgi:hypothetical protein
VTFVPTILEAEDLYSWGQGIKLNRNSFVNDGAITNGQSLSSVTAASFTGQHDGFEVRIHSLQALEQLSPRHRGTPNDLIKHDDMHRILLDDPPGLFWPLYTYTSEASLHGNSRRVGLRGARNVVEEQHLVGS